MTRFFDDIIRDKRKGPAAGLLKIVLWFLSLIYGCAVRIRNAGYDAGIFPVKRLPRPVICVGNITVGGTGKTPFVILLANRLKAEGRRPAILTRGYRSQNHDEGNDEVRMMRAMCPDVPVIVGSNRFSAASRFLQKQDADIFIMDDGFQHRRLARDLDIVLVESLRGFGGGHLLPRGILREPVSVLKRADIVVVTKLDVNPQGEAVVSTELNARGISAQVIRARQTITGLTHLKRGTRQDASMIKDQRILMLSSIADPESFEETLKQQGARIAERLFYPDHYDYQETDIRRAIGFCEKHSVNIIVTTAKDAVKLERFVDHVPAGIDIWILSVETNILNHEDILFQRIRGLLRT